MIIINSNGGRMGNKLHYFFHAMHCHKLTGMKFIPERIEGFVNTYNAKEGIVKNNLIKASDVYHPNVGFLNYFNNIKNLDCGLLVDAIIHKYDVIKQIGRQNIINFLEIENESNYEIPSSNDLVIHIRLGDYVNIGCVTLKDLYKRVIINESFDKCYIVTDDPNRSYLDEFKDMGCLIRSNSILEDFIFLKNAKKIVISKSSYSWTAAYISNAEKIYFPLSDNQWPMSANPTWEDTDIRPIDLPNWIYI